MIPTEELRLRAFVSGEYAGVQGTKSEEDCPFSNPVYRFWWQLGADVGWNIRKHRMMLLGAMEYNAIVVEAAVSWSEVMEDVQSRFITPVT